MSTDRDRSPLRPSPLDPWLTCNIDDNCPFGTRHPDRLARHSKFHSTRIDVPGLRFACPECPSLFMTFYGSREHFRMSHGGVEGCLEECRQCGKEVEDVQEHLKTHQQETSDPAFNCGFCPQSFRRKGFLIRHLRKHYNDLQCSNCSKNVIIKSSDRKPPRNPEDIKCAGCRKRARRTKAGNSNVDPPTATITSQTDDNAAASSFSATKSASPTDAEIPNSSVLDQPQDSISSYVKSEEEDVFENFAQICARLQKASGGQKLEKTWETLFKGANKVTLTTEQINSSLESLLFNYAETNDVAKMKIIMTAKQALKGCNLGREHWTWGPKSPLQQAAYRGNDEMIELLIKAGFNVNSFSVSDKSRCTALHLAVRMNLGSTVKLLLSLGANKIQKGTLNELFGTPLDWAASLGKTAMIKLLIQSGDRINNKNMFNGSIYTALHLAVNENQIASVKTLLNLGAKVGPLGSLHVPGTPLHIAASKGRDEIVQILIQAGADVNTARPDHCTPLHLAVFKNRISTVKLLLEKGADVTLKVKMDEFTGTPLDWARQKGLTEIARMLILQGQPEITIADLKTIPIMEKSFSDALDTQEEISSKKKTMKDIDQEISKLQEETKEILEAEFRIQKLLEMKQKMRQDLKKQIQEHEEGKKKLLQDISCLEKGSRYKSEQELELLKEQLLQLKSEAASLRDVLCPNGESVDRSCPVCFDLPKEVFSCAECDNWICGKCRARLEICPICRVSFLDRQPNRNKTAERLLGVV